MKVLQINTVCGILSTGKICTDLAEVLKKNGYECEIAYGREEVPESYQNAYRICNDMQVKIDAFKTRLFDNAGLNNKVATKKLIEWIKAYSPDIIHLHNIHGYYLNIKFLFDFLKKYGKPVVWTLHDCWSFTGHCVHFETIKCEKWKNGCGSCPKKNSYPQSMFFDFSRRNYNLKKKLFTSLENLTFITPSQWLADVTKQSFLGKYDINPIPNGVDLEVFKPTDSDFRRKYDLVNKKIVLGVASAWVKNKGIDEFVQLSKILPENFKVVIVGMKKEQAEKMPENILVIPRTTNITELAEIYTAADVFLNPSRFETMGLTTVEAMACGTPVVTSNCTAVPEVVTESSGIVCDNLEIETIKNAILKVLSSDYPNTRQDAQRYEKFAQYEKYLELYQSVLN